MSATPPKAVLTDIEGTVSRISYVHDVLFPYARDRLEDFIARHAANPEVQAALAETDHLERGKPPVETLLAWIDADAKMTPLKTLQGLIWAEGFRDGDLHGELYPDVALALRRWHAAGVRLYVYSSGSETAQRLLFGHTPDGDLTPVFDGFFDTRIGGKREAASYTAIAQRIGFPSADILFLSDIAAELDAASAAGFGVCQVVRPADGTKPSAHASAADFDAVSLRFGLPA